MAPEIGLQELVSQVKKELLAPVQGDPIPLLYVESVELELGVVARKEGQAGVKLYVVDVGGATGQERAQTVRVCLRPLYSREELRALLEQDPTLRARLQGAAQQGALKGDLFPE